MRDRWRAAVYEVCRLSVLCFSGFFLRLRVYGQANVPRRGGALLLSNHQSFLDPPLVGAPIRRHLTYMARDTLFRNPLFGALLRALNVFPLKRGRADRASMRRAIERLRSGEIVVLFPEGTRASDGVLQPIKGGFRLLLRRSNVPVIPAALVGAHRAWPRTRRFPRPTRVRVMYGRAIQPEELADLSDREVADRVAREISLLLDRLRRLP